MNTVLELATRDLRHADLLERLDQKDKAGRIRQEVRDLLKDMPHSNNRLQATWQSAPAPEAGRYEYEVIIPRFIDASNVEAIRLWLNGNAALGLEFVCMYGTSFVFKRLLTRAGADAPSAPELNLDSPADARG